tara:strand:+ start:561 stop:1385 length:825 start_codon:yes stop_codon:yes gene_type:complete
MIDYVVISYNRPDAIKKKTLKMLAYNNIPRDKIYIVVADKQQEKLYRQSNPDYKIVVGQKGIINVRNFVRRKWNGKKICMMDDDIKSVKQYLDKGKWGQLRNISGLDKLMTKGFELLSKHGGRLIGLQSSGNTRSLNEDITSGLAGVAQVWGEHCDGKIQMKNECSNIEDSLLSLAYYKKWGGGVVFRSITTSAGLDVRVNEGGMQSKGNSDRADKSVMDCQMRLIIKPFSNIISSYKQQQYPIYKSGSGGNKYYRIRYDKSVKKTIGKLKSMY